MELDELLYVVLYHCQGEVQVFEAHTETEANQLVVQLATQRNGSQLEDYMVFQSVGVGKEMQHCSTYLPDEERFVHHSMFHPKF